MPHRLARSRVYAALAVAATVGGVTVPVFASPPVVFLDERPVEVTASTMEDVNVVVRVRNTMSTEVPVILEAVDVRSAEVALAADPVRRRVEPSSTADIAIVFRRASAPGRYEGRLVIEPLTGEIAARPVIVTVKEPAPPFAAKSAVTADAGSYTATARSYWPSYARAWDVPLTCLAGIVVVLIALVVWVTWRGKPFGTPVAVALLALALMLGGYSLATRVRDEPAATKTVASVDVNTNGTLVGPDGSLATLANTKGNGKGEGALSVSGLRRAGVYKGTIDLTPGVDKGELAVTVNVRDLWAFAVIALSLGVVLAATVMDWFTSRRAVARQRIRWLDAEEALGRALSRAETSSAGRPTGLDVVAVRLAGNARRATVDEDVAVLKETVSYGTAFAVAVDRLTTLRELLSAEIAEARRRKREDTPEVEAARVVIDEPGDVREASGPDFALITAQSTRVEEALTALQNALAKTVPARDTTQKLKAQDEFLETSPVPGLVLGPITVTRLDGSVADTLSIGVREPVVFATEVKVISGGRVEFTYSWTFGDGSRTLVSTAAASIEATRLSVVHQFDDPRAYEVEIGTKEPAARQKTTITVGTTPAAEHARRALRINDGAMNAIAGAIAVGSGLLAVYFTSAGWGSPSDYLQAFLWGGTVSEGIKAITAFVSRTPVAAA